MNGQKTKQDQRGVASILVVMILMTVLALISVGFSRLMNQEVKRALNRQLSTVAYYAAESGVNDAKAYLDAGGGSNSTCDPPANNNFVSGGNITGDNLVKYSCVIIDTSPKQVLFHLNVGESRIYQISQPALANLYFGWQNSTTASSTTLGSLGYLPKEDSISTNATGILRLAIYPVPPSSTDNSTLTGKSRNYFLYPSSGGGGPGSVSYGSNGGFVSGNCRAGGVALPNPSSPREFCNSVVNGLVSSGNLYYVRITAMYTPLQGVIVGTNSGGVVLPMTGNQSVLDITGTGNDISQRIRTIVDNSNQYNSPINAVWSMNTICKLFRVPVSSQGNFDTPEVDTGNDPSGDSACQDAAPTQSGPVSGPVIACTSPPGCPATCGGDTCGGGGGGGGGGGCTDPPGCPPTCGGSSCPTPVATVSACLLEGAIIPGLPRATCTGGGGVYGQACQWSDGHYTWGAC